MRRQLCTYLGLYSRSFLGWAAGNGFDDEVAGFAALLEGAFDRRHRHLKSRGNLSLAMALVNRSQNTLA